MSIFAAPLIQKSIFLIVLGIMAQWIAWGIRFPAIVLLSIIGLLVGPIFGWLDPGRDFGQIMEVMIKLSVAIILFEGGLNLKISELKQAGLGVGRLVLFGLPIAWVLGTACAYFIAGLSLPVSSIIGAILVVTGPTVIIPLLRQIKLTPKVTSLMKWEGIVNDPLGVLLAVFVFEYYIIATTSKSPLEIVLNIGGAILTSLLIGVASGFFIQYTFQRKMCPEFLKVPVILCFILLIYGVANMIQEEAGLLAVTAFGFTLCNVKLGIIHELRQFKEYISIFLLSTVFIALTASLNLEEQLYALNWRSIAFLCSVLFVMRPVAVWLATLGGDLTWKERLLLGWIAPRGVVALSVAGLFAPTLMARGYEGAEMLIPLVFGVVFITVVLHGLSLGTIARALDLAAKSPKGVLIVGASPWTTELAMILKEHKIPVLLVDHAWHKLQEARSKNIPVFEGEILSSSATQHSLNLTEMNYILSVTDNDAYNALVCNAFKREFDQQHVFQLSMHKHKKEESNMIESVNRGCILFGELKYEQILDRYFKGWHFQEVLVDKKFKFKEFLTTHKDKLFPLFVISKNQEFILEFPEKPLNPVEGDLLYCLVDPEFSL